MRCGSGFRSIKYETCVEIAEREQESLGERLVAMKCKANNIENELEALKKGLKAKFGDFIQLEQ
jgi:chaperonin cofactor prefoldin